MKTYTYTFSKSEAEAMFYEVLDWLPSDEVTRQEIFNQDVKAILCGVGLLEAIQQNQNVVDDYQHTTFDYNVMEEIFTVTVSFGNDQDPVA